ncbi:MAG: hypothetical protein JST00_42200 [Deltaproteobacteria bacterium]|nr:hypothetical protein [Deltaproteobacteria bacterium]
MSPHDPHSIAPTALPSTAPAPRSARDASTLLMGIGVAVLVALSLVGLQLGRQQRAAKVTAAVAAAPPPAVVSAIPTVTATATATATPEPPVSIELDEAESVPTLSTDKLPDVTPLAPAAADTTIHGTTAVPPNPY